MAGDEKFMIWFTSGIKLSYREMPPPDQFAFINTAYDLQLINKTGQYGFPVGNQAITDREKLARLFNVILTLANK